MSEPPTRRRPGLAQRFMESPAIARIYERRFRPLFTRLGSSLRYADEERWLRAHFRPLPGRPVLDLACGTGRYTRLLAGLASPARAVGLDLSAPMLAEARRAGGPPRYVRGSALALPFAPGTLGGVCCFGALHLFPDPQRALREIGAALAPDGSFACLAAARVGGARGGAQRWFARLAEFRFFAADELESLLAPAGLTLTSCEQHGMLLLFAAARRP